MCGIVGYVGPRAVQDVLLGGLEKLDRGAYLQFAGTLPEGARELS